MGRNRGTRSRVDSPDFFRTLDRVLVIDEDLNPRLSTELSRRKRPARRVVEFHEKGTDDSIILRWIVEEFPDHVYVTGDDSMPWDHAQTIADTGATIATIAPCAPNDPAEDAYEREIVHRWAHLMHEQPAGSVRRYHLSGPVDWTPPKKKLRKREQRQEVKAGNAST